MHTIRIDEEIFEALNARVIDPWQDSPNDVLRRVLGLPEASAQIREVAARIREDAVGGQLLPLIRGGHLNPGQQVTWHRVRLRRTHTANVTALGFLVLEDGTAHKGPDIAASHLSGHPAKGWAQFTTAAGTTLADLAALVPAAS